MRIRRRRPRTSGGLAGGQGCRRADAGRMRADAGRMRADAGRMRADAGRMRADAGRMRDGAAALGGSQLVTSTEVKRAQAREPNSSA